jgi:hypothetical protein
MRLATCSLAWRLRIDVWLERKTPPGASLHRRPADGQVRSTCWLGGILERSGWLVWLAGEVVVRRGRDKRASLPVSSGKRYHGD